MNYGYNWVGDYDASGAPKQQAIWLDDLPVGLLNGAASTANRLHYIEPDHRGTPRAVIEPQRDVAVWAWDIASEAFDNSAPNPDPDGDSTAFTLDMRFPGQRYDAVSGLNYNYFRDYEAGTGRYSTPDPIGLLGGVSLYGYVGGNPLTRVDQFGLATAVIFGGPVGDNPFGHVAIAVSGSDVYSFGTATPFGSSISSYLLDQAERRDSTVFIINTTPEEEAKIMDYLRSRVGDPLPAVPGPDSDDTCATRTNEASRVAGMHDPSNPYSTFLSIAFGVTSPLPESSAYTAAFYSNLTGGTTGSTVSVPRGSTSIPAALNQFNGKP
ncbi:hypothetical protein FKV24_005780 [Lysobacter maris]|uniref:Uncharacterized protein n=1 Tax=Marilutibacter maris TaxID=1605891 RepID=A0A508B6F7_9GAMM|nr:hypothetical protein FKV24_005780 [Lysobacter maris]